MGAPEDILEATWSFWDTILESLRSLCRRFGRMGSHLALIGQTLDPHDIIMEVIG